MVSTLRVSQSSTTIAAFEAATLSALIYDKQCGNTQTIRILIIESQVQSQAYVMDFHLGASIGVRDALIGAGLRLGEVHQVEAMGTGTESSGSSNA